MVLLRPARMPKEILDRDFGRLSPSEYSSIRDLVGAAVRKYVVGDKSSVLNIEFIDCNEDEVFGALVGMELAAYSYKHQSAKVSLYLSEGSKKQIEEAKNLAAGVNISRHFVNMPGNDLYPDSYAKAIKKLFPNSDKLKVDVWSYAKLEKEGMGLHLAVGEGSDNKPCLVHIKYRPSKKAPIALVGKGITFDTGGVDLKPASAMRNMKKDMGGSACVVGLAYSLVKQKSKQPFDAWLPLAENSVSGSSFRPGDIVTSKNGMTVEIHNTDAEGRLVLADALQVATTQKAANKPTKVINVATLTGAVKVGIGVGMAGFYSNVDKDAEKMIEASTNSGDFVWQLPLFQGYRRLLSSHVADINHCASSGWGGSITAALF